MKNDTHPLIKAMGAKRGPETSGPTPFDFGPSREVQINHHELTGLGKEPVGATVTAVIHGTVKSQHSAGHAVVEITHVKPDSDEMQKKTNPDFHAPPEKTIVMSQDSHSPG